MTPIEFIRAYTAIANNGQLVNPRLVVSGLSGTLQLTRDRLRAPALIGAANGGPLKITVDISHSYSGDLTVSLVKGSTTKVLSAAVGGVCSHFSASRAPRSVTRCWCSA